MNDKIIEFISNVNSLSFDEYSDNLDIKYDYYIDDNLNNYSSNWLNQVEEYLPFISTIVNIDYTNGNNEIVLKSYENRFIKTLLYRLYDFLLTEKNKVCNLSLKSGDKKLKANIKSIIENEEVEIELSIKSKSLNDNTKEQYGLSILDRIERLLEITSNLLNSNFIKKLEDASLIQGNIERTEIFDIEINYKKAYELFIYLEKIITESNNNINNNLKNRLLVTSYLDYQVLNEYTKDYNNPNIYKDYLEKIIEKMVSESSMDEKSFKKMLTKKFEDEYLKKKNREKTIQSIFIKAQDNYNKQIKDALRALKD